MKKQLESRSDWLKIFFQLFQHKLYLCCLETGFKMLNIFFGKNKVITKKAMSKSDRIFSGWLS